MVLIDVYDEFASAVETELRKTKTDREIERMLKKGLFQDKVLQVLAKALTVSIYRNGAIEDVHSGMNGEYENFNGIPNELMKIVNKDVCNKMYTMLTLLFADDNKSFSLAMKNLIWGGLMATSWDTPEIDETMITVISDLNER